MMAALTAPDARKLYHLALAQAAAVSAIPRPPNLPAHPCGSSGRIRASSPSERRRVFSRPAPGAASPRPARLSARFGAGGLVGSERRLARESGRARPERDAEARRSWGDEKPPTPGSACMGALDRLGQGWQEDLSLGRREAVIRKWLAALNAPPFTGIRSPATARAFPARITTTGVARGRIDALAGRKSAPDSR